MPRSKKISQQKTASKKQSEPVLNRVTKDELRQLVLDTLDNKVFYSTQLSDKKLIELVFIPIRLGAFQKISKNSVKNVGNIYEYYEHANKHKNIEGFPIFFSCNLLHKKDWEVVQREVNKELKRREKINIDLKD